MAATILCKLVPAETKLTKEIIKSCNVHDSIPLIEILTLPGGGLGKQAK